MPALPWDLAPFCPLKAPKGYRWISLFSHLWRTADTHPELTVPAPARVPTPPQPTLYATASPSTGSSGLAWLSVHGPSVTCSVSPWKQIHVPARLPSFVARLLRFAEAEELLHASVVSDACTHRSEAAECVLRRPGCPLRRVRRQLPWRSICERQFLAQIVSFAAVAGGRSTPSTGTRRRAGLSFC
jgi:hypothetical protein